MKTGILMKLLTIRQPNPLHTRTIINKDEVSSYFSLINVAMSSDSSLFQQTLTSFQPSSPSLFNFGSRFLKSDSCKTLYSYPIEKSPPWAMAVESSFLTYSNRKHLGLAY